MLVLPPDHKSGDKHPLIVKVHGGPVYQFSHEFMFEWQALAAKGYAVLAVNPRGSSGRGFDFAKAIYADWGNKDVADVSAGIDAVIKLGVIDAGRIGVGGWSYGGILTNYMIASDKRIKAAVSGAGMSHFIGGYGVDQYARDYEFELGTPWDKPEVWKRVSYPFFKVKTITAATLFLCSQEDTNVPCIGGEQMYQALRSRGVPTRLVVYPGETHSLSTPSHVQDRIQRSLDWYDEHLTK
jgi:dipeptidyl aminopeptidase/acylaminoacyl peptidase